MPRRESKRGEEMRVRVACACACCVWESKGAEGREVRVCVCFNLCIQLWTSANIDCYLAFKSVSFDEFNPIDSNRAKRGCSSADSLKLLLLPLRLLSSSKCDVEQASSWH